MYNVLKYLEIVSNKKRVVSFIVELFALFLGRLLQERHVSTPLIHVETMTTFILLRESIKRLMKRSAVMTLMRVRQLVLDQVKDSILSFKWI